MSPNAGEVSTPAGSPAPASERARLVIFDFDGVVADSEVISLSSLRDTLCGYGIDLTPDEVRRRYLGLASDNIIRDVTDQGPNGSADGFKEVWHETLYRRFRNELRPVDGLLDLLDHIESLGLPFCIASSGSFERLRVALEATGLTERFVNVFSADLVQRGKPAPDLFLYAARQMGVAPHRCLVVEDSQYGIRAAKAAGMRAVGFLGGSHLTAIREAHRVTLSEAGADVVFHTLKDLVLEIPAG